MVRVALHEDRKSPRWEHLLAGRQFLSGHEIFAPRLLPPPSLGCVSRMHDHATFRELTVERLVIREPNEGRVRSVLETSGDGRVPGVRLSLLDARGEPAIVAQIDGEGSPTIYVGPPDHGTTMTITPCAVDCWFGGNVVASLRSSEDGGSVEVTDGEGRRLRTIGPH